MHGRFRKRPVDVDALLWTGDNYAELVEWAGDGISQFGHTDKGLIVRTLEGDMLVSVGDWIIRGIAGEFYPCRPDIFEQTYEAVL